MQERLLSFAKGALTIWQEGGWVMIPLVVLALLMAWTAFGLLTRLRARQHCTLHESQWKEWVRHPERGEGEVGEMIRYALDDVTVSDDIAGRFGEIRASLLPPVERQLSMLGTYVAAAPLIGLLGTVFGMLLTFSILASGGGGDVTGELARGIKQALYPPQVGLCIALPGLILAKFVRRQVVELDAFLAQLESYAIQLMRARSGMPFMSPVSDDTAILTRSNPPGDGTPPPSPTPPVKL